MRETRRAVLKSLLATGVGTVAGTGAYGFVYERHDLEVTRATVPVVGLPSALAGLRIGLLTDVHRSQWVSHDDVIHAVLHRPLHVACIDRSAFRLVRAEQLLPGMAGQYRGHLPAEVVRIVNGAVQSEAFRWKTHSSESGPQ